MAPAEWGAGELISSWNSSGWFRNFLLLFEHLTSSNGLVDWSVNTTIVQWLLGICWEFFRFRAEPRKLVDWRNGRGSWLNLGRLA